MSTIPAPLCATLETAINHALALDPEAMTRLPVLAGRQIEMTLKGAGVTVCIAPLETRIRILPACIGEPDTRIELTPGELVRAGALLATAQGEPYEVLSVKGDIDTGRDLYDLLRSVDIDWEELLAGRFGDVAAHQVGNLVRRAAGWGRRAADSLTQDLTDYLREESGLLPTRVESEIFMDGVDELRNDAERLAARIERLAARRGGTAGRG